MAERTRMYRTSGTLACRRVRATATTPRSFISRVGFGLVTCGLIWLSGCASSSSETPWPVEPDFERLKAEAAGHPRQAHAGTEWTPRDPEGDEVAEPEEEAEPPSTWGGRRRAVLAEPPPLRAGTPDAGDEPAPKGKPEPKGKPAPKGEPKAAPSGIGDTDDIDNDPFFQDDEEED